MVSNCRRYKGSWCWAGLATATGPVPPCSFFFLLRFSSIWRCLNCDLYFLYLLMIYELLASSSSLLKMLLRLATIQSLL